MIWPTEKVWRQYSMKTHVRRKLKLPNHWVLVTTFSKRLKALEIIQTHIPCVPYELKSRNVALHLATLTTRLTAEKVKFWHHRVTSDEK